MSADILAFVTKTGASLWSAASELLWLALGFARTRPDRAGRRSAAHGAQRAR